MLKFDFSLYIFIFTFLQMKILQKFIITYISFIEFPKHSLIYFSL